MSHVEFGLSSDQELLDFFWKYRRQLEQISASSYERLAVEQIVNAAEAEIKRRNLSCDARPAASRRSPLTESRVLRVVSSPIRAHRPPR
jgi:hypothetical protein